MEILKKISKSDRDIRLSPEESDRVDRAVSAAYGRIACGRSPSDILSDRVARVLWLEEVRRELDQVTDAELHRRLKARECGPRP